MQTKIINYKEMQTKRLKVKFTKIVNFFLGKRLGILKWEKPNSWQQKVKN